MGKIILFAIPMIATVPVAVLICRIRIARKRRISFGTVLFTAFVVTLISIGVATGGEIYTVGFWDQSIGKPVERTLVLKAIAFMILMCALPALGVVHGFQRWSKREENAVGATPN